MGIKFPKINWPKLFNRGANTAPAIKNTKKLNAVQKLLRGGTSFAGFSALGEGIQRLLGGGKDKDQINKDKPTKDGALAFLGGKKTGDPEPDIQYSPVEVLDNISQSLLPNETIIPEIDTTPVMATGMDGIIAELAKINFNLAAIRDAMVQSALIESQYRQELINDLEDALARRGKERSLERTKKKKKNILRSQIEPVTRKIGTTASAIAKATALGVLMETIAMISNIDSSDEPEWQKAIGSSVDSIAGYLIPPAAFAAFGLTPPGWVVAVTGLAGSTLLYNLGFGKKLIPELIPNENPWDKNKSTDQSSIQNNTNTNVNVDKSINTASLNNTQKINNIVPFDFSPIRTASSVGTSDNSTTVIDLRTAKNLVGGDTPTITGVNESTKIVAELPRITHSGYEALAKGDSIT